MDDDLLTPFEAPVMLWLLFRFKLRARMALERDVLELEARVGHELPAVRAQLEQLASLTELPVLPALPRGGLREPGGAAPPPADELSQRKRGRPKKQRDADESDAPGTELS